MAGLVPAIYAFLVNLSKKDVDARDKRGHDSGEVVRLFVSILMLTLVGSIVYVAVILVERRVLHHMPAWTRPPLQ